MGNIGNTKCNEISKQINTYRGPNKTTKNPDPKLILNLNIGNNPNHWNLKDFKKLNRKLKNSKLENIINLDTFHQQD